MLRLSPLLLVAVFLLLIAPLQAQEKELPRLHFPAELDSGLFRATPGLKTIADSPKWKKERAMRKLYRSPCVRSFAPGDHYDWLSEVIREYGRKNSEEDSVAVYLTDANGDGSTDLLLMVPHAISIVFYKSGRTYRTCEEFSERGFVSIIFRELEQGRAVQRISLCESAMYDLLWSFNSYTFSGTGNHFRRDSVLHIYCRPRELAPVRFPLQQQGYVRLLKDSMQIIRQLPGTVPDELSWYRYGVVYAKDTSGDHEKWLVLDGAGYLRWHDIRTLQK